MQPPVYRPGMIGGASPLISPQQTPMGSQMPFPGQQSPMGGFGMGSGIVPQAPMNVQQPRPQGGAPAPARQAGGGDNGIGAATKAVQQMMGAIKKIGGPGASQAQTAASANPADPSGGQNGPQNVAPTPQVHQPQMALPSVSQPAAPAPSGGGFVNGLSGAAAPALAATSAMPQMALAAPQMPAAQPVGLLGTPEPAAPATPAAPIASPEIAPPITPTPDPMQWSGLFGLFGM